MTHVPTSGGLVNPAAEVGRLARAAGVPYLLDACQSVGQMPIDVEAIGCDFLSTTGRKFLRGPRGTGFLYVDAGWAERLHPAVVDLGGAEWTERDAYALKPGARRFETWEAAHALRLGLGAAIDYALAIGVERIWARISVLASILRDGLGALPASSSTTSAGRAAGSSASASTASRPPRSSSASPIVASTSSCPPSRTRAWTSRTAA